MKAESYAVDVASTGEEALHMAEAATFDLIIVNSSLPGIGGLEILKRLRAGKKRCLSLILTSKARVEDRVFALDSGADDIMTKPFSIRELLARVRALLRRASAVGVATLRVADLEMDRIERRVWRGGRNIELSPKEFALLEYFMSNPGRALTRQMIIEHVWNFSFESFTNIVDVYINYLRVKVDRGFDMKLIRTVRGVGYRLSESD